MEIFYRFKDIFCNKRVPLPTRCKLYTAVVTPTVLYGCSAWVLSTREARRLICTQRRMLRWMLGVRRQPDEDWVHFVKRATHASESAFRSHGCESWLALHIRRKWDSARKLASRGDSRWALRLLHWKPWHHCLPYRSVGRPHQRWTDAFVEHCDESWADVAANDPELWSLTCETCVLKAVRSSDDDDAAAPY